MKKLIVVTGVLIYVILIFICFAVNAQQAATPLVHVHSVKEFKGKTITKDTTFRMDTTRMRAMMHRRFPHHGKDSAMAHRPPVNGNPDAQARAGRNHKRMNNIDSISINIHSTMHGDSMIRESRRITYFKPDPSHKNHRTADTVYNKNITVHKGWKHKKPSDLDNMNPDLDGQEGFLPSESQSSLLVSDLKAYPNPGNGLFRVTFSLPDHSPVAINITDINGKSVWQDTQADFNGKYDKNIDISGQSKGIYLLQITQNNKTMQQKLVTN